MRTPVHSVEVTQVVEWADGRVVRAQDFLAVEEPLEIRVNGEPMTVTMRTPGHDLELAAGFLLTEGLIDSAQQIASIESIVNQDTQKRNLVAVTLRDIEIDREQMRRNFFTGSSCGVCGKASIEAVRRRGLRPANAEFRISAEVLCTLPNRILREQAVFDRTGGLHAAALFTAAGELLAIREDIGRHNAVDKIVGWAANEKRLPLDQCALMVSGRGGFEIIQKAIAAGIPIVASISAPSSLAVQLARELRLTLVGFLRGQRFVIYSCEERCVGA